VGTYDKAIFDCARIVPKLCPQFSKNSPSPWVVPRAIATAVDRGRLYAWLMSELPWPHSCCILCNESTDLTREHIIPQQIGGKLWARFLCKPCNDLLGSDVEATAKRDPSIRMAVENLEGEMPDLAQAITEGQEYVATSGAGVVRARKKRGAVRVRSTQEEDGSIIQPTQDGREHIENVMRSRGMSEDDVHLVLERFDGMPNDVKVDLLPGVSAVKWQVKEAFPALDGPRLSDEVLLKIAYEFIACHCPDAIYQDVEPLNNLRGALRGDGAADIEIEHLTTRKYRPLHGLALEDDGHVIVNICLFGWLFYRVHLLRLQIPPPFFAYSCDLSSGEEGMSMIVPPAAVSIPDEDESN